VIGELGTLVGDDHARGRALEHSRPAIAKS
jgi:hypothetical protein